MGIRAYQNDAWIDALGAFMKTITLRNVPTAIAEKIQQQAERNGTSLNKAVVDLLAQAINGSQEERHPYHDLDHLAGSWSAKEAETIDAELDRHRPLDAELWK
jgi:plasmid stability protein